MPRILQPAQQKRLTNVAVVRLKQDALQFEVACYPNKVKDWRLGTEKDISEVLQSDRIFSDVHKGKFAKDQDIQQTFGTLQFDKVVMTILNTGEIQISGHERKLLAEQFLKEVSQVAAERLRSASTGCPLTAEMVENCLKQMKWKPKYKSGTEAKAAANRVIDRICKAFPNEIQRTLMRATILCLDTKLTETKSFLESQDAYILGVEKGEHDMSTITFQVANSSYRALETFVVNVLGSGATLSVVSTFDIAVVQTKPAAPIIEMTQDDKIVMISSSESDEGSHFSENLESQSDGDETYESDHHTKTAQKNHFELLLSDDDEEDVSADESDNDHKKVDTVKETGVKETGVKETGDRERGDVLSSGRTLDLSHREIRQREKELEKKRRARDRKLEAKRKEDEEIARITKMNASAKVEDHHQEIEKPSDAQSWCDVCRFDYQKYGFNLRQHYKDEWHTFNQKRRVRQLEPISRVEHADLARDLKANFLAVE